MSRNGRKTLVVLRAGWPFALRASAYRAFFRRGFRVVIVERPTNAGLRVADDAIIADLQDPDALLEALRERVDLADVAGVLTFNDAAVPAAARLARALGLPGLDPEAGDRARDKIAQRRCFAAAGLAVPELRVVADEREAARAVAELGTSVVKPADSTASGAVQLVEGEREALAAYAAAARRSPTGRVLVESFVDGPEMTVETVCVDGEHRLVGMTDTTTGGSPFFIELGHAAPARLNGDPEITAHVFRALDALGIDHGLICTEVKATAAGPVVVEVNPRPPGDAVVDLLSLVLGLDLHDLVADLATGEPIQDLPTAPTAGAAIAFLLNPVGRVKAVDVGEPVLPVAPRWLRDFAIWVRPGDRLAAARSNGGRAGYAIAVGETADEAAARARRALAAATIDVDD